MNALPGPTHAVTCARAGASCLPVEGAAALWPPMKKLVTPSAAPTPAAMNDTVDIVAVVCAESMSPHVEGGQRSLTHALFAEFVDERDIAPVTAPTTTPAA